jgi:ABC-type transport system involved in multi-copper enzyme maturation permease subunit
MREHFRTALRLGLRSRSFLTLALVGVLAMGLALAASQFSGRQPATVAMDVGLSAVHIIGILLTLFWAQELFARDLDRGLLPLMLAYPVPRSHYLLGRFLGLAVLLVLALGLFGVLLAGLGWLAGLGYDQATPVHLGGALVGVLAGVWLELLVVGAFAWLVTSLSTTPLLPFLLGLGFAWAARSLGPVLDFLRGSRTAADRPLQGPFQPVLEGVYWALPDLSRLDWRGLALYGQGPGVETLWVGVGTAVGYAALLLGLAAWAFQGRELA